MKVRLSTVLQASALCGLVAFSGISSAKTWNWAMTPPEDSHYGAAGKAFKAKIEELSNGDITVSIKSNGVLGGEREIIEGMQIGSIEMGITSTGPVGGFVPETYVLDLPFLFKDYASARAVMAGPIGNELLEKFQSKDIMALGWAENGFRYITNSKQPIQTPSDLSGMKIRTMENDIHLSSFRAVGAAPTPMGWPEVIPALQQGTIDGQETPMSIFIANRIWEVQKYATLTGHFYSPAVIMMSKHTWDSLSEKEQGWVREAARAGVEANQEFVNQDEAKGLDMLRANGMEVVTEVDNAQFANAMDDAYQAFAKRFGTDMLDKVRAAQQ